MRACTAVLRRLYAGACLLDMRRVASVMMIHVESQWQTGADAKGGWQVIEAAIENVKLKQQIFADLEKACRPDAILSSNTSTIDISLVRQLSPSLTGHSTMLWPDCGI